MKKLYLVLLCFILGGCQQPSKEISPTSPLFDKAAFQPIEKLIIQESETAQIVRDPKQLYLMTQMLKGLPVSTNQPQASESFIYIKYKDRSSERFTFNQQQICQNSCADWEATSFMKLASNTKVLELSQVPTFLTELFESKLTKAIFFQACEEEMCKAEQLDEQELDDFQLYLRQLAFGKQSEQPKTITHELQVTLASKVTLPIRLSISDEGRFLGVNDEWISFDFQDGDFTKQLLAYSSKSVQAKNPNYRQSTFFTEGVGATLEMHGFMYDEESHEFTRQGQEQVKMNESQLWIDEQSYDVISDRVSLRVNDEVCSYSLNAQKSDGCTLEEAKEAYLAFRETMEQLLLRLDLTLNDVRSFMLEEKESRFMKQLDELYPSLSIEKEMLGNVTDLERTLIKLGYTKNGNEYSMTVIDPIYDEVVISYQAKDLLFKVRKGNSYAQIRLGSEYGEGVDENAPNPTICTFDTKSGMVVGDCLMDSYYAPDHFMNVRHVLLGWQHQLSFSDEELQQYAQMLSED